MRTLYLAWMAVLAGALAVAAPAHGQEPLCKDAESVEECFNRLREEMTNAGSGQAGSAGAAEAQELQRKAAGPNVSEDLAQSAIRDFLPRFAGTLLTSDPTEDLHAVDFRFNAPVGRSGRGRLTLQGGVTLHQAELYAPLVDSVPESIRAASRERLQKELEDGDDATAFVTINLESRSIGRDFANQQDLVDRLAIAIADSARSRIGDPPNAINDFGAFSPKLGLPASIDPARRLDPVCMNVTVNPPRPRSGSRLPVSCLTPAVRAELETLLTPVAQQTARMELTMGSLLSNSGFDRISELVNNQPQVNFSAEYRSRLEMVGPNEFAGRARVEMGFANMNGLRRHCVREIMADTALHSALIQRDSANRDEPVNLACLRSYTQLPSTRSRLARSDRLWFAGEVRYRPEYDVSLPEDSVDFTLGSGVGFGVSGGYGRYLGSADADDKDRDRIDLHVSYDFADGEDLRQSRLLAGVFYTLRISGNASGVVGLTWANKPEFVEGADRQLGANLGLSYKFNRGKEDGQD